MNCTELQALLSLTDAAARVEREELRAHFAACRACAAEFPEVRALVPGSATGRRGPRPRVRLARALAALLLVAFAAWIAAPRASHTQLPVVADHETPGHTVELRSQSTSVDVTTVRIHRGRLTASSVNVRTLASRPAPVGRRQ